MIINNILERFNKHSFLIEIKNDSEYINYHTNFSLNLCTKYVCEYEKREKITMENCFKNYIEEEKLDKGEEWDCPNCKKKVITKKRTELYYLPKIFIVCLSRFIKYFIYFT